MDGQQKLIQECIEVLRRNNVGGWTKPAPGLYPHQWLWDSCFIAIGQRHFNVKQAKKEVENIFRGQWKNGMIPNIIYGEDKHYNDDIWHSKVSKQAPKSLKTSGITQPPMIAEAITLVGEKLTKADRKLWYRKLFPKLLAYHEWLYRERDPRADGLVVLLHPWESGLDNTPSWMSEMHLSELPLWIRIIKKLKLYVVINVLRRETKYLPAYQRIDFIDALGLFSIVRRLRRKKYETRIAIRHSRVSIQDVSFNSILIRANELLIEIARVSNNEIPAWLLHRFKKASTALNELWHEQSQQYLNRNYQNYELINEPSIMTFFALYSGAISKKRAAELVQSMKHKRWSAAFPLASVPKDSAYFQPKRYWQGPTWINTNWLIANGLHRYGYHEEAAFIAKKSIELVQKSGCYEYFSPLDGSPSGVSNFSWTAALTIDFLHKQL